MKISFGTSFVRKTESQVNLNGSRGIPFTMDLVLKDGFRALWRARTIAQLH